jgi:hypothetical protein
MTTRASAKCHQELAQTEPPFSFPTHDCLQAQKLGVRASTKEMPYELWNRLRSGKDLAPHHA